MEGLIKGANPFWAAFFLPSWGRLIWWKLLCKSTTLFSSPLIGMVTIPPLVLPSLPSQSFIPSALAEALSPCTFTRQSRFHRATIQHHDYQSLAINNASSEASNPSRQKASIILCSTLLSNECWTQQCISEVNSNEHYLTSLYCGVFIDLYMTVKIYPLKMAFTECLTKSSVLCTQACLKWSQLCGPLVHQITFFMEEDVKPWDMCLYSFPD